MGMIDADAFDERIRLDVGSCEEELTEDFKDGIQTLLEMMKTAPTVDAVPVVHGQWIIGDDGLLHCSKCSKTPISRIIVHGIQIFDMTPVKEMMKYCPNCGAKMDGKDGDHHDRVLL